MIGHGQEDLERWLEPFTARLSHQARRRMLPLYVAGLIAPGERKSVQPLAARIGEVGYDRLHHFVSSAIWDSTPLETTLRIEADRLAGGAAAILMVGSTVLPKRGRHSVGVAPQPVPGAATPVNCQLLMSLALASAEVAVTVGLLLHLPESWTRDPARMARAQVPQDRQGSRAGPEAAIEEIDRVIAAGVRFGCVLDDAGHGRSAAFRRALDDRGLSWAMRVPHDHPVRLAADAVPIPAEAALLGCAWQSVETAGDTGEATRGQTAARRILSGGNEDKTEIGAWLIAAGRPQEARDYWLSNLPAEARPDRLAGIARASWMAGRAGRTLKQHLGLGHFEGRSWTGLHRHALMTMIAQLFLESRRLSSSAGPPPAPGRRDRSPGTAAAAPRPSAGR